MSDSFAAPWTAASQAPVCEIVQAGILEWVAIPFSRGSSQPRIIPGFPTLKTDSLLSEPPVKPGTQMTDAY